MNPPVKHWFTLTLSTGSYNKRNPCFHWNKSSYVELIDEELFSLTRQFKSVYELMDGTLV